MEQQTTAVSPWWKPAIIGMSPIFVLAFTILGIVWSLTRNGVIESAIAIMALAFAALIGSAYLTQNCYNHPRTIAWCYAVSLMSVVGGWLWQRVAFTRLVPNRFLEYGYFLKPSGQLARRAILEMPALTVTSALVLSLAAAIWIAGRSGARWSLIVLAAWWFALFVLFGLPSFNWSLQGDAAIFI